MFIEMLKQTPCTLRGGLLKTITEAAKSGPADGAVSDSPVCSSFDSFRNDRHSRFKVCLAAKSIGRGASGGSPKIHGKTREGREAKCARPEITEFGPGFFEGKPRSKN